MPLREFAEFDRRPILVAIAGPNGAGSCIGLSDSDQSVGRVAMRVSQGGHDVPEEKLRSRFSRTLANLQAAIARLPHVLIYDNSDLNVPYRQVAVFDHGQLRQIQEPVPEWLRAILP
jgi:predicted ABC-type ATPase